MTELVRVRPEDRELLWNINQKYLYEMTNFYDDPMDEAGNLHYGHFEEYFRDPDRRASPCSTLTRTLAAGLIT